MGKVIVTCDSTCDLTPELYQKYDIHVAPLYIRVGDNEYRDGVTIDTETLFQKVQETGELPKTAAVSVDDYVNLWKPFVEQGCEVVHINISSHFSACYQNACAAAEELGHVYPVDSLNLSSGSGHLAIEAALLAQEGRSGAGNSGDSGREEAAPERLLRAGHDGVSGQGRPLLLRRRFRRRAFEAAPVH